MASRRTKSIGTKVTPEEYARIHALVSEERQGAAAAQIAAHQTREAKLDVSHEEMQRRHQDLAERYVDREEHRVSVLVPRQEITGTDRQWAERYEPGDVVRCSRGSKALGIEAGDYARVEHVDAKTNQVTVRTDDERTVMRDYSPIAQR